MDSKASDNRGQLFRMQILDNEPAGFNPRGVSMAADMAERIVRCCGEACWNIPHRGELSDPAFVGVVLSALKENGNGFQLALTRGICRILCDYDFWQRDFPRIETGHNLKFGSGNHFMPTPLQARIMSIISQNRHPESYCGGGSVLNIHDERLSNDMDIFHSNLALRNDAMKKDVAALRKSGLSVKVLKDDAFIGEIRIRDKKTGDESYVQWVMESPLRFFPAYEDEIFGYRLHPADLAVNKIKAFSGRLAHRDAYDVCRMIERDEPVKSYVWAACAKEPAESPLAQLEKMPLRMLSTSEKNMRELAGIQGDCSRYKARFQKMLDEAREAFANAPMDEAGCLYLSREDGNVFWPTPEDFASGNYEAHFARECGGIPRIFYGLEEGYTPAGM